MTRPRGFIDDWKPKSERYQLVCAVQAIIGNSTILPLTLRQIFYMLVTGIGYDKTEKAYKRLCEAMNIARRAQVIRMEDIRDDGLTENHSPGWADRDEFLSFVKSHASHFTLDRQENQPIKTFVWCEAGGMVPQLADAVDKWHVPVLSSGGFDSVTTKHNFAERISKFAGVMILHLGDHDPSGVHMFGSLDEDLTAFVDYYGGDVELRRIAVTPRQVVDMNLPTSPPKVTDNRSFSGETTQCEAIPPERLRVIVQDAVKEWIDVDLLDETIAREREISAELSETFKGLMT